MKTDENISKSNEVINTPTKELSKNKEKKTKHYVKLVLLFIAITIFACLPYFKDEVVYGNDTSYHLNRILAIVDELKLGNFPVLIHSNLLYEFGYANPLFYPELFLYIPAVCIMLGMDTMVAYKLFLVIITFATVIITYYSMNLIFKDCKKSLLCTLLYTLSTYRLGDIYVRNALGEEVAFVFLPLVFARTL